MRRIGVGAELHPGRGERLRAATADLLTIRLHNSHFEPDLVRVRAGVPVTITLRNDEPIDHEWIVGPPTSHAVHRHSTEAVHERRPTEVSVPALSSRVTRDHPLPGRRPGLLLAPAGPRGARHGGHPAHQLAPSAAGGHHAWMLALYALCGLPFAGKSTLARALAAQTDASLVVLDAINHERGLGLAGSTTSADDWRRTYAEAYRRIARHLALGRSVIFDHANLTRAERDQVRAIGQRAGAQVQCLYVAVSEAVVRQRWRTNCQTGERYDVPDEMFDLALRAFQAPDGEPDVVKIETLR